MSRLKEQFGTLGIVLFAVMLFLVPGCKSKKFANQGQTVKSRELIELKRGISLAEMELVFQINPTHEFTVRRGDDVIRCVSYTLIAHGTGQTYYFVFTNDALALICVPPTPDYGARTENGNQVGFVIVQPEKTVETVIHSEDLKGEALAKSVSQAMSQRASNKWDMKMVPLVIIFAPIGVAAAPVTAVTKTEWWHDFDAQREKFDPFKVRLGMTIEEVKTMFGEPYGTGTSSDNLETHFYGPPRFVDYTQPWVSVVFDHGKVVRVFSDQFFDSEKKREFLRQKQAQH